MQALAGTTEVGEVSSSEDVSWCLTRLLVRVGLVEGGAGVWSVSTEPVRSTLKSSSNLPGKGIGKGKVKTGNYEENTTAQAKSKTKEIMTQNYAHNYNDIWYDSTNSNSNEISAITNSLLWL